MTDAQVAVIAWLESPAGEAWCAGQFIPVVWQSGPMCIMASIKDDHPEKTCAGYDCELSCAYRPAWDCNCFNIEDGWIYASDIPDGLVSPG